MANLQKVRVHGKSYKYIVQSRRADGKRRAVSILHSGSSGVLLDRLLQAPAG